jgi:hypothetical protein
MNVLVTSSRMPFALDEIRKLGRCGHRVYAADTIFSAPGGHSRYVAGRLHVTAPEVDAERFVREVKQFLIDRRIELVVPCFEEVFYLARHLPELNEVAQLFAPGFELLRRVHNKATFNELARELEIGAPETLVATSDGELDDAVRVFDQYLARPAYSRGGVEILTNAGPLEGALTLADCRPTRVHPWIVQPYLDGRDLCSFSVAQHGRVVAHCAYVHPVEIEHGGGIVFESVDEPETLRVAERLVAATGYHGQLGLDFRRSGGRLYALECNPRPTAGVHLFAPEPLVEALMARPDHQVHVVPPGRKRKYASALLRDLLLHWDHARADVSYLLAGDMEDVYGEAGDRMPALFQVLSYAYVLRWRAQHRGHSRRGTGLLAAIFDGIEWNGDAIP